ncbi:MAG: protein translocase SEC61 complex subunit gamma [Candidatus Syntropharchaeia archaeon]
MKNKNEKKEEKIPFSFENLDIRKKLDEYAKVIKLARKPDREEFLMISKVAGAGILLIGLVGFLIYVLMGILPESIS